MGHNIEIKSKHITLWSHLFSVTQFYPNCIFFWCWFTTNNVRSTREGNVFSRVCDPVQRGKGYPGPAHPVLGEGMPWSSSPCAGGRDTLVQLTLSGGGYPVQVTPPLTLVGCGPGEGDRKGKYPVQVTLPLPPGFVWSRERGKGKGRVPCPGDPTPLPRAGSGIAS